MIEHRVGHCVTVMTDMAPKSVQCVITSPPYWALRNYGTPHQQWRDGWVGELGQESHPTQYVNHLVEVFDAVRRVLVDDGVLWVNIGDTFAGARGRSINLPGKTLVGVPWRFALAMIDDGWILRQDIVWHKPDPMPEPVKDRCVRGHEYVFMFTKQERYWWDYEAIMNPVSEYTARQAKYRDGRSVRHKTGRLPGEGDRHHGIARNQFSNVEKARRRTVWTVPVTHARGLDHYAGFPEELVRPMVLSSCPAGGTILDPFGGSGTTALVATSEGRHAISIDINDEYSRMAERRTIATANFLPLFDQSSASAGISLERENTLEDQI